MPGVRSLASRSAIRRVGVCGGDGMPAGIAGCIVIAVSLMKRVGERLVSGVVSYGVRSEQDWEARGF